MIPQTPAINSNNITNVTENVTENFTENVTEKRIGGDKGGHWEVKE